jgi:hypothetical protein
VTWVQRTDRRAAHRCPVPRSGSLGSPDGDLGDLWRCDDCRTLWRIGDGCDTCDRYGPAPHPGTHAVGQAWRPATWWQRLRHWRKG